MKRLTIIAGPCVLDKHTKQIAEELFVISKKYPIRLVFKASFDKANRTSASSQRGPGLIGGLLQLADIACAYPDLDYTTDIHEPHQVDKIMEYDDLIDVIQIPAFLGRQTDLLVAAAASGKIVNVKKPQFEPWTKVVHIVEKLEDAGAKEIWVTERGSCFGPSDIVIDFEGLIELSRCGRYSTFLDITHPCHCRSNVAGLMRLGIVSDVDGLFMETHINPEYSISDSNKMVHIRTFEKIVAEACKLYEFYQMSKLAN